MFPIDKYESDIKTFCSKYKVRSFYVFGSALTSDFNEQSDLDFIVDFEPLDIDHYADNYFNLKFALEGIFKRKIDLLEEKTIKNPYFKKSIENQRQLLYGV
jgi:predicted nucleotidyltransferase